MLKLIRWMLSITATMPSTSEVARAESIRSLGFTYKDMEAAGVIMPIVEIQCKFLRPAHYDDLLSIKTTLKELPANHRIEFHQEVYNEAGKLLTIGHVVLYFLNAVTREKTVMPADASPAAGAFFNGHA